MPIYIYMDLVDLFWTDIFGATIDFMEGTIVFGTARIFRGLARTMASQQGMGIILIVINISNYYLESYCIVF